MLHTPDNPPDQRSLVESFFAHGWCRFPHDPRLARWVEHVCPHAAETVRDPSNAEWMRYGDTWFAGVNVLGNDGRGRVDDDAPDLDGQVIDFIRENLDLEAPTAFEWDRGQVSVCYPGYPKPMASESEGAFRYRVNRDAAHLDGLHPVGPDRRRHLREPHAFVLGIPLTNADEGASPLVVWEGSHHLIREALQQRLRDVPTQDWGDIDVTDVYQAVRKKIFETCARRIVHARPGECYLIHRLTLHGVAPWQEKAKVDPDGRMIVYFRPEISAPQRAGFHEWLTAP